MYDQAWNYFLVAFETCHDLKAQYQMGVILYDELISSDLSKIKNPKVKINVKNIFCS